MKSFLKTLAVPLLSVALLAGCAGNVVSKVEEPAYTTLAETPEGMSLRAYPALVVAEVTVSGQRDAAINAGFRQLADYIFGGNIAGDKIPMTAPVRQHAAAENPAPSPEENQGEKIPMTAPVRQQSTSTGAATGTEWVVQFVMPQGRTLANLPTPRDPAVRLTTTPPARYGVIRFSGRGTPENLGAHLKQLEDWLRARNLVPQGAPLYAFYNPPWVLPFLRRNEIWLAVPDGAEELQ